jgi:hypothetical protein
MFSFVYLSIFCQFLQRNKYYAYKVINALSILKYIMDDIFDTNADFQFDKISLITPTSISGGIHFSKILINKKQLYIQSPKCKTKQGIVKTGKKIHADLVFSNDDEEFIQWIQMLELTVRKHIYINREKWFDMDLDEDDIESYFTPTVKIFKSGKQYIMRVNVSQRIGSSPLKIYDENELDVEMESIHENTPIITILEIQGVRCSSKNFQIDVELKQMMVLKPVNLFEKCIIKSKEKDLVKKDLDKDTDDNKASVSETPLAMDKTENPLTKDLIKTETEVENPLTKDLIKTETEVENPLTKDLIKTETEIENPLTKDLIKTENPLAETSDTEDLKNDFLENSFEDDILEINLNIDEMENFESIHLKEKTEVYYQMYKEARQKAKLAKSLALSSYLEARRIKNLYMLDDIDDSDESDLEDL